MGLAGGRKRAKISHDPNNTTWSRNTSSYGHRMLTSQGWQPGSTLGARNPAYSKHLTQASQSHIKVMMRDDNLGLGAKRGSGQEAGECVGLDAFQAMLGRLNGKSEEVLGKEQDARDDLKRRAWVEKRGKGMVHFVYGGRLVGDEVKEAEEAQVQMEADMPDAESSTKAKKSKKEKRDKKARKTEDGSAESLETDVSSKKKDKKKDKKRKRKDEDEVVEPEPEPEPSHVAEETSDETALQAEDEATRKARRKAEKAEKRERKRLKKAAKAAKLAETSADATSDEESDGKDSKTISSKPVEAVQETITLTPKAETAAATSSVSGRHMSVRSRYIAAKRRAVMDPQALKEILMVKA